MKKPVFVFIISLFIFTSFLAGCAEGIGGTITQTVTSTFTTTTTFTSTTVLSTVTTTKLLYPVEDMTWVMEAYGDSSSYNLALENVEFTLYLDTTDGSLSGYVGPNRYEGKYRLYGDKLSFPGHEYFVTLLGTHEAVQQQQSSYFSILMNADTCEVIDGKLHITGGDSWIIYYKK